MAFDIGIDLGTASILVYVKGKGVVLKEPSVVAFDRDTNRIKAIGEEARLMLGRTPGNIVAVRPLRQGVISDYTVTEKMLKYFIQKAVGKQRFRKPLISICVPSQVTEVERKAVEDAAFQAGARDVKIIEEPIAAAIGAGIDIARPCGNMIVDIGGGTSDIAVISLGGTVVSASIKIAGDDFDDAIVRYMRKKHNLLIGERTAEDIKIRIGSAYPRPESVTVDVRGRNLVTGLPKTITVTSEETEEALNILYRCNTPPISEIADNTKNIKTIESYGTLSIKSILELTNILKMSDELKKYFYNDFLESTEFTYLSDIFSKLYSNSSIIEKISYSIIDENTVDDRASKNLASIRKKQRNIEQDIKTKLNTFLHSPTYSKYIQENVITIRNDRYVIPVKDEYRGQIKGFVHDISSSGSTVFIEPLVVFDLNNELSNLHIEEEQEIERIIHMQMK